MNVSLTWHSRLITTIKYASVNKNFYLYNGRVVAKITNAKSSSPKFRRRGVQNVQN